MNIKEMAIQSAKEHNERVDIFMKQEIVAKFGEKVTLSDWIKVQQLIGEQHFYMVASAIVKVLREEGIDAKVDAQKEKIHAPEVGISAY